MVDQDALIEALDSAPHRRRVPRHRRLPSRCPPIIRCGPRPTRSSRCICRAAARPRCSSARRALFLENLDAFLAGAADEKRRRSRRGILTRAGIPPPRRRTRSRGAGMRGQILGVDRSTRRCTGHRRRRQALSLPPRRLGRSGRAGGRRDGRFRRRRRSRGQRLSGARHRHPRAARRAAPPRARSQQDRRRAARLLPRAAWAFTASTSAGPAAAIADADR